MSHGSFLHIADVHFDAPLGAKSDALRNELREATFAAFENAVSDAIAESVDAVLIAGDLFDHSRVSLDTEARLRQQLGRLAVEEIPVIIVTGNHDSAQDRKNARTISWTPNVRIVDSVEPVSVDVFSRSGTGANPAFVVVASGHEHAAHADNLVARFPRPTNALPHVGLVHAMVSSESSSGTGLIHNKYAPCTTDDLRRPGYSYWALGHVHVPGNIPGTVAYYSGCLQGRHHKEGGLRGGYLVTLDSDGLANATFRPYAPIVWDEVVFENDVPDDLGSFERQLTARIQSLAGRNETSRYALRIVLRGQSALAKAFRDEDELDGLASRYAVRYGLAAVEIDATGLFARIDLGRLRREPSVVSEVLAIIDELTEATESGATVQSIVPALFNQLDEDYSELSNGRIRSLLSELSLEAVERMVDASAFSR